MKEKNERDLEQQPYSTRRRTGEERRRRARFVSIGVSWAILLCLLIGRLAFIQIVDGAEYAEQAKKRQQTSLNGLAIRGIIYDRNMEPLTNREKTYIYFVPKSGMNIELQMMLLNLGAERISTSNAKYDIYRSFEHSQNSSKNMKEKYKVFEFTMNSRYERNQVAEHLIGYINARDNKGQTGLEAAYDSLLRIPDNSYYVTMDGTRRIIDGFGMSLNEEIKKTAIVTTLDYNVQRKVEEVMKEYESNGSVVILDAKTGDLIASASTPGYDPDNMEDYINSQGDELINKSIRGEYAPGSVFKIVVMAAALELEKFNLNSKFVCNGYEEINGVRIACSSINIGGHGGITLEQAFEKSCNSAFIQMGKEIGGQEILSMALKFGIGKKALENIPDEKPGNLPTIYEAAGAGVGNLAIGQGELTTTPLQIAKMTNVIASGGKIGTTRLVKGEMTDGKMIKEYEEPELEDVITQDTAAKIQNMMKLVIDTGTANNINLAKGLTAAGKTGSAQSSDGGEKVVHGWFTGFVPADNPEYTITVFVKNGNSGRQSAVPILEKISNEIYK